MLTRQCQLADSSNKEEIAMDVTFLYCFNKVKTLADIAVKVKSFDPVLRLLGTVKSKNYVC